MGDRSRYPLKAAPTFFSARGVASYRLDRND